jgi:hypothetical protein
MSEFTDAERFGMMEGVWAEEARLREVRALRDAVYEKPISDKEWMNCAQNWLEDIQWLRDVDAGKLPEIIAERQRAQRNAEKKKGAPTR